RWSMCAASSPTSSSARTRRSGTPCATAGYPARRPIIQTLATDPRFRAGEHWWRRAECMAERMIPLLQCRSIDEIVDFYRALGFEITFYQKSPYSYCAVRRGGIEMEFFGTKSHDPAAEYGGCYVLTEDVDTLYQAFREGLKRHLGKIPTRGLPRI